MEPIKELKDEIVAFGERLKFENFEKTQDGHLTYDLPARWLVEDEEPWVTHDFYLRVGLHLGRVMQVIMSCGHFVKMRKEDRWAKENFPGLSALDPLKPHLSLYRGYGVQPYTGQVSEHWRPDMGYVYQYNPYAQQQQLQGLGNPFWPNPNPYLQPSIGGGAGGLGTAGGWGGLGGGGGVHLIPGTITWTTTTNTSTSPLQITGTSTP